MYMRMVDLIAKKRDGLELAEEEIRFIVDGYTKGEIPDYQMSAFAMAVYFQNMTAKERAVLTMAMAESGEMLDLSEIEGIKVDKHSTGGVGDKTTLALAPLVASCGVPVAKMSGRGLGHTGGTIDKLESIPGFQTEMENERFIELVNKNKIAVIGQTANLAPADKKLYSLRDVTATVNSIPLIASSIMSKKIAAGADAIVLDVKTGTGAFMKNLDDAKKLAEAMTEIGHNLGRKTVAIISDMNQPLGYAVGNALEVKEAIDLLHGNGPKDLLELCLTLGSHMVYLAKKASSLSEARKMLLDKIQSKEAVQKMKQFIISQGGDDRIADMPDLLPQAKYKIAVKADQSGYVAKIFADQIGLSSMLLGAGRKTKDSPIDLAVGIVLHKKIGDKVTSGDALATIHANQNDVSEIIEKVKTAYTISDERVERPPLIYDVIQITD